MPQEFLLSNRDPLDFDEVLFKVEASFNFKFSDGELKDVQTFGELCDAILGKLQLPDAADCTTQQAFYKLRNACCQTMGLRVDTIVPSTPLNRLFPRKDRRKNIRTIENSLDISLKALRPAHWLSITLAIALLLSLFTFFVDSKFTLLGLFLSIAGVYVSSKFGKEFKVDTFAGLVRKMTRENYLKSRRNPITVNKKEVVAQVRNLFAFELDIDGDVLLPDAKF